MRLVLAAFIAITPSLWSPAADACSCAPPEYEFPVDGQTDVPRQAIIRHISVFGIEHLALLEVASGVEVPSTQETISRAGAYLTTLVPDDGLEPNTEYEILWAADGTFRASRFTTGDHLRDEPPSPVEFSGLAAEVIAVPEECIGLCDSSLERSAMTLDYAAPGDEVAFMILEWMPNGDGQVTDWFPVLRTHASHGFDQPPVFDHYFSDSFCSPAIPQIPEGEVCARLVSYNVDGGTSLSETICVAPSACEIVVDPAGPVARCTASGDCSVFGQDIQVEPLPETGSGCSVSLTKTGDGLGILVVALALVLAIRRRA